MAGRLGSIAAGLSWLANLCDWLATTIIVVASRSNLSMRGQLSRRIALHLADAQRDRGAAIEHKGRAFYGGRMRQVKGSSRDLNLQASIAAPQIKRFDSEAGSLGREIARGEGDVPRVSWLAVRRWAWEESSRLVSRVFWVRGRQKRYREPYSSGPLSQTAETYYAPAGSIRPEEQHRPARPERPS